MKKNFLLKFLEYLSQPPSNNFQIQLIKFLNSLSIFVESKLTILFIQEKNSNINYILTYPNKYKKIFETQFDKSFLIKYFKKNKKDIEIKKLSQLKENIEATLINSHYIAIIPLEIESLNFEGVIEFLLNENNIPENNELSSLKTIIQNYINNLLNFSFNSKKIDEFTKLIEISNILNSTLNIDLLIDKIIGEARKVMQTEGCSLMLIDPNTNELAFKTVHGKKREIIKEFKIPAGKGIAGFIAQTGESVIVNDVRKDPRFYIQTDLKSGFKTKNLLGVPLKVQDKIIGVIEAVNKKEDFNKDDLKFFQALANQASIAIQNAQLYSELRSLFLNTIRSIVNAIDAKDPYTKGHSERVTKYSVLLAKHLKLQQNIIESVQLASLLHDVGKIGIDEKILRKPSKLTDEEYNEIKKHPVIGENILKPIESLKEILPAIRHHHERWDGRGYPDNLKENQIPFIARIIALADTYDAITSDRPYRKGKDKEYAIYEIKRCSGLQFDPYLVKKFIDIIKND